MKTLPSSSSEYDNEATHWLCWGRLVGLLCASDDKADRALGDALYREVRPQNPVQADWMYAGWLVSLPLGPEAPEVWMR